ncbi:hypothetical protein GCM10025789_28880 [Tessaracoccus lubricantis]|uniref:Secreted protein n=1 Tax=Tessaracoccus lubricantis TaxID=545543 RepID=A0ABP9FMD4_9ACTN
MTFTRTLAGGLMATAVALMGLAVSPQTAQADTASAQIKKLCGVENPKTECSIDIDSKYLHPDPEEGVTIEATITGVPDVTVPVAAYYVECVKGQRCHQVRASDPVTVTLGKARAGDTKGVARVTLKTRPLTSPLTSRAGLRVQTDDWQYYNWVTIPSATSLTYDPSSTLVVTKRPRDLGFSEQPDKHGVFDREIYNASASAHYSVQVKVGTRWVSADRNGPVRGIGPGWTVIPGQLPIGLASGTYQMRVVNVTHGQTGLTPETMPELDLEWKLSMDSKLFNVYVTPGTWDLNGRKWRTSCEPYSATDRCRTEIQATQILYQNGTFKRVDGWAFNNLTYKPSPRSLWKGNPLGGNGTVGYAGQWKAADGRQWRVECDTAASGRNGCRSYAMAKVAEPTAAGAATYHVVDKWLFNNIVQFS